MEKTERRLYDLAELQKFLPCSRSHIYNAAKRKEIPVIKIGRRLLVPSWYVDEILNKPERKE